MTRVESDSSFYIEIIIIAVSVTAAVAAIGVAGVLMIRYNGEFCERSNNNEIGISDIGEGKGRLRLRKISVISLNDV